jgi:hypothetical protein
MVSREAGVAADDSRLGAVLVGSEAVKDVAQQLGLEVTQCAWLTPEFGGVSEFRRFITMIGIHLDVFWIVLIV